jgi:DNA-binding NtrC family response regulator
VTHDAPTFDPDSRQARLVLVVVSPDGFFARELPASGSVVIGRSLECDVRLDDAAVSRRHAVLDCASLTLVVESKTGRTRVDGRDVPAATPTPLLPGQVVELGRARLVVRRESASPSSQTDSIALAAKSDLPVLLLGETGSGKDVAMQRIVAGSRRRDAPVVRVDCAAANDLETPRGGTIFLDEIAELSSAMQAKILRIIEAGETRVIAASNRDLRALVASGALREDLYFRVAGVVVNVAPLRDRVSEIPDLARTILGELAASDGRAPPPLTDAAIALLTSYRWPGNVRELRHVLARALHAATDAITPEHVELLPPPPAPLPSQRTPAESSAPPTSASSGDERGRIIDALTRANGNQKEAARLLGMTRRMLMYRLDAYKIPRPRKR